MEEPRSRVAAIARSTSLWVKEPVVIKSSIVGVAAAIGSILVISGVITEAESEAILEALGIIVPALLVLVGVVSGIWSRASVDSPKTSAATALVNVEKGYRAGLEAGPKPDPVLSATEAEVLRVI